MNPLAAATMNIRETAPSDLSISVPQWGMPLDISAVTFVEEAEPEEPEYESNLVAVDNKSVPADVEQSSINAAGSNGFTVGRAGGGTNELHKMFWDNDGQQQYEQQQQQQEQEQHEQASQDSDSAELKRIRIKQLKSNATNATVPIVSALPSKQPYNEQGERVYCICRQIDNGRFMIQCDQCKDWYHGACVNITERMGQTLEGYECPYCIQSKNGATFIQSAVAREKHQPSVPQTQQTSYRASQPRAPPTRRTAPSPLAPALIPKPRVTQRAAPEPDVGPTSMAWIHDKTRSLVRKSFGEVLRTIVQDLRAAGENGDDEWTDVTELAGAMEDELFDFTADGEKGNKRSCGDKYKSKFRSLQFNLKDKKNSTLRIRLLKGTLSPSSLVRLNAKELANDELKARSEEIRILAIHNAVKPKEAEIMYKKTHKGDEEVKSEIPSSAPKNILNPIDSDDDDKDSNNYSILNTTQKFPAGIAGIVAAAEAAAKSALKVTVPKKIESLDDLLSKMDGTTRSPSPPSSISSGNKRSRDETLSMTFDSQKRTRAIEESNNSIGVWENSGLVDGWGTAVYNGADGDDSWMRSPVHYDQVDEIFSTTPKNSPPPSSPPSSENSAAFVWSGTVRMPQVAKFAGRCNQIAGRNVPAGKLWEDLLPPTVFIEGRIDVVRTQGYIDQQKLSASKEVIAVEFIAGGESDGDQQQQQREGFNILFDYFIEKQRYAVVGQRYVSVRDMYLVPVRAGDLVPQTITVLSKFNVVDKSHENRLFGVMILDKAFFAAAAVATTTAAGSKSSQQKLKNDGADSTMQRDANKTKVIPPTPPATIQTTVPGATPWAGLTTFAQTQQQHVDPTATVIPQTAQSATALALLMQLQRQQAVAQQNIPIPQGIAGLLSQIQAAQQKQQQQQQSTYGSSVYGQRQ